MSDSAVCTKKQTIKTVINIKLRSAWGAIVSATFLYGAPLLVKERKKRDQGICQSKRCFCLPSGSGKSLIYQLAQMVYVMVILHCSDWLQVYQIGRAHV